MTDDQRNIISRMLRRGCGYGEISKQLGLSYNSVKSFCRRHKDVVEVPVIVCRTRCKRCGKDISCTSGHRQREFCSDTCRYAWWYNSSERLARAAVYTFQCANCGQTFHAYGNAKRKYCSHSCYIAGRYEKGGDEKHDTGVQDEAGAVSLLHDTVQNHAHKGYSDGCGL